MRRSMRLIPSVIPFLVCGCGLQTDKEKPEAVPASKARDFKDKTCIVEMTVLASKKENDRKVHFLDSEKDYKDPKNFAVKIDEIGLERFATAGIDNPSSFYKGKTIRVTGKVSFEEKQYLIVVTDPLQIEVVNNPN
jgi:hypothetical protein